MEAITVKRDAKTEFTEKKSVFISRAFFVTTEEEAEAKLAQVRDEHSDATHNCWAYNLRQFGKQRCSDDGEPQGTAGMPILNVIKAQGVVDVLVVVTRYFGGILLGAGGLVRAYGHAAKIALDAANIITYEKYEIFSLNCGYSDYQKFLPLLSSFNAVIDDTVFEADVTVTYAVKVGVSEKLEPKISEMSFGKCQSQKVGERFDYR